MEEEAEATQTNSLRSCEENMKIDIDVRTTRMIDDML